MLYRQNMGHLIWVLKWDSPWPTCNLWYRGRIWTTPQGLNRGFTLVRVHLCEIAKYGQDVGSPITGQTSVSLSPKRKKHMYKNIPDM